MSLFYESNFLEGVLLQLKNGGVEDLDRHPNSDRIDLFFLTIWSYSVLHSNQSETDTEFVPRLQRPRERPGLNGRRLSVIRKSSYGLRTMNIASLVCLKGLHSTACVA